MRAKVWKAGNSYQTTIPTKWVEEYATSIQKERTYEIDKVLLGKPPLLIISPPYKRDTQRILKTPIVPKDEIDLKMKIVNAYLEAYDVIDIDLKEHPEFATMLDSYIRGGTLVRPLENNMFRLTFSYGYGVSVDDILYTIRDALRGLHSAVAKNLAAFPSNSHEIEETAKLIEGNEATLDGTAFYFKRQLNLALSYPEVCLEMGIDDFRDFIYYDRVIENFERIGDLHFQAMGLLKKMLVEASRSPFELPALRPFREYYEETYETVLDALQARRDREKRLRVIKGRMGGWETYGSLLKRRQEVINFIEENDKRPAVVRYLTRLDEIIWGIPGAASNVCEAFDNIDRLILNE